MKRLTRPGGVRSGEIGRRVSESSEKPIPGRDTHTKTATTAAATTIKLQPIIAKNYRHLKTTKKS